MGIVNFINGNAVLLVSLLSLIVALDHVLASSDLFKANSSFQALLAGINSVAGFLLGLLSPKQPPSA